MAGCLEDVCDHASRDGLAPDSEHEPAELLGLRVGFKAEEAVGGDLH